ncbi:YwqJ-related putative deaminase [Carbonactinospora thermoautotrophica]|uniref:YwqJ-related putative deaminase n=1 Tax=Carbonactinospora thermoautotrophica TaxID=1469144 RepID=UPI000832D6CE|nr:YwqJ-related putative deaminase [Carbonactinospora thermoautotrophica]
MITREEAQQFAEQWVAQGAPPGAAPRAAVYEFDLGYVVWPQDPPGAPPLVGAGRGVIDKETGELSVFPSVPVEMVVEQYRQRRAQNPPPPRTFDPAAELRRDLRRKAAPATVAHLTIGGRLLRVRSKKGDGELNHHPLVREFLEALPVEYRERGYDRCAEAAALSDALHEEDARRRAAGLPPITLEEARTAFFRGANVVTYRVREPGDPVGGQDGPPCLSCLLLLRYFGFQLPQEG